MCDVHWIESFSLIDAAEVLVDEIGDVGGTGVGAQDAEEIVPGDDPAASLVEVILHETEEGFIADALADFFEEVCALEIGCVRVGSKSFAFIDGNVYEAFGFVEVNTIQPPPTDQVGMCALIVNALAVGGESFIKSGLGSLVTGDLFEPPLMRGLMHGDKGQIVGWGSIVEIVKIAAEIIKG